MSGQKRFTAQFPDPPADLDSSGEGFPAISGDRVGAALLHRGARRWYFSAVFGVAWLGFTAYDFFQSTTDVPMRILAVALLLVFAGAVVVSVPIAWWLPVKKRILVALGLFVLSFMLWPILGFGVSQTWVFVGIVIGMSLFTMRTSWLLIGAVTVLVVIFQHLGGTRGESLVWLPAIVASISMMMSGFSRQIAAIQQLRATQHELARLAVAEERGRVARDIHDILGHSLTAITVRAELAGILVDAHEDAKASVEIAAVEELAREALADVRGAVAGYRGVNVVSELANAKSILASAGIDAELPTTVELLRAQNRELAGWIVREGVTNVVRHSGATRCRIRIGADSIEVEDDGHGAAGSDGGQPGSGLRGLGERVQAAGGRLTIGRSDLGGFALTVSELTSASRSKADAT
jgi:two-component system sensor histidine kinase DesK